MIKLKPKDKEKAKILIATGGSGGHIFPALPLNNILSKKYTTLWVTDFRATKYLTRADLKEHLVLNSKPLSGNFISKLVAILFVLINTLKCLIYLFKHKPKAVLTFGYHVAAPVGIAAFLLGIPLIIHEQNIIPSKTNRLLSRFAKLIITSFEGTKKIGKNDKLVGLPIREEFLGATTNNTKDYKILILGGSQASHKITEVIPNAISLLPSKLQSKIIVSHQSPLERVARLQSAYSKTNIISARVENFFEDIVAEMSKADLIITRAGASTIAEIEHLKKPAILIPMKRAANNHQSYNAAYLSEKSGAIIVTEDDLSAEKIKEILEKLFVEGHISKMGKGNSNHMKSAAKIAVMINDILMKN